MADLYLSIANLRKYLEARIKDPEDTTTKLVVSSDVMNYILRELAQLWGLADESVNRRGKVYGYFDHIPLYIATSVIPDAVQSGAERGYKWRITSVKGTRNKIPAHSPRPLRSI